MTLHSVSYYTRSVVVRSDEGSIRERNSLDWAFDNDSDLFCDNQIIETTMENFRVNSTEFMDLVLVVFNGT